ncbi:MAG: 30S ribosomal protein S20 [Oscillospiraceae bacterium]
MLRGDLERRSVISQRFPPLRRSVRAAARKTRATCALRLQFNFNSVIINGTARQLKGGGTMPNIQSQKKRVITNAKSAARNKAVKTNLRTALKKAEAAIASGTEDSAVVVSNASSVIDKAAKHGVLHKNTAARKKSAIARKANTDRV